MCKNSKLLINPNWCTFGKPLDIQSDVLCCDSVDEVERIPRMAHLTDEAKFMLAKATFTFAKRHFPLFINVPCGYCSECLSNKSIELGRRAQMQCLTHPFLYFVTLTYRDWHLPYTPADCGVELPTLVRKHVVDFLKRLRSNFDYIAERGICKLPKYRSKRLCFKAKTLPVHDRFCFTCIYAGEYGSETKRPHYHLLFFFDKPFPQDYNVNGFLQRLVSLSWEFGNVQVQCAKKAAASCNYMTKYLLKSQKINQSLDPNQHPCFFQTPRRHGLGAFDLQRLKSVVMSSPDQKTRVKFYNCDWKTGKYSMCVQTVQIPFWCIRRCFPRINDIFYKLPYYKYLAVLLKETFVEWRYYGSNFCVDYSRVQLTQSMHYDELLYSINRCRYLFTNVNVNPDRIADAVDTFYRRSRLYIPDSVPVYTQVKIDKRPDGTVTYERIHGTHNFWWSVPSSIKRNALVRAYESLQRGLNGTLDDLLYLFKDCTNFFDSLPNFETYMRDFIMPYRDFYSTLTKVIPTFYETQKLSELHKQRDASILFKMMQSEQLYNH